ncbi:centromere protein Q [Rhinophrynus dorsalis]
MAHIAVLPKPGKDKSVCSNYRPISLLNTDLKLFASLLALRLKPLLHRLIGPDQAGFMPGRETRDNVIKALSLIHRSSSSSIPSLLLSLDAEKAFDRVRWCFMKETIHRFGLGDRFISAVFSMYNSPSAQVAKRKNHFLGTMKQKSRRKQCVSPSEIKSVRETKDTGRKHLTVGVQKHIESYVEAAILSALSREHHAHQDVQILLRCLKQKLLSHCKQVKAPSTKLGILKNLKKDLFEELHKKEGNEIILMDLKGDIEKAVESAHQIEEQITVLEEAVNNLKQVTSSDIVQLPDEIFQAPTMQENIRMLKKPNLLLKDLHVIQSNPVSISMQNLIAKSYNGIDLL